MVKQHKYTDEERAFFIKFVPGHSYKEIQTAFNEKFQEQLTLGQVRAYVKNNKLNTGKTGRFEQGHIPFNKGKKGICAPGSEQTWFKKGHVPHNHRPIGSQRITRDGYVEIKVAEPNKWRLKHRLIWEGANGAISKGDVITFLDGDKENCALENLLLVSRKELAILNKTGLITCEKELKKTVLNATKLILAIGEAKKERRKG